MRPCPAAGLRRPAPCFSPHVASGQRISGALACAAGWCGLVVRLACAGCGGGCVCQGRARRCCGSGLPLRVRGRSGAWCGCVAFIYICCITHIYICNTAALDWRGFAGVLHLLHLLQRFPSAKVFAFAGSGLHNAARLPFSLFFAWSVVL